MNTNTKKKKKNNKIYIRLRNSFLTVIIFALFLGIAGTVMINMVAGKADEMYNVHLLGIEELNSVQLSYCHMRLNINKAAIAALSGNADEVNNQKKEFNKNKEKLDAELKDFENKEKDPYIKEKISEFRRLESSYVEDTDRFFSICMVASSGRDVKGVNDASKDLAEKAQPVETALNNIVSTETDLASRMQNKTGTFNLFSTVAQIALTAGIIIFSVLVAVYISNGIEKSLKSIIDKMTVSTGNISVSAAQLSVASESVAVGSAKQAAAIEETSATMNETATMVAQNAENTQKASYIATETAEMADKGMKEMAEMVKAMEEIKASSDKVSKIVKTIDDIAFQTNLLSVNAAVEAARAGGEAGRSFAVVAREVRELAHMSAKASAETAEIIEKNIALTSSGREASKGVAASLGDITGSAVQLNKLMSEISAASEQQASGIKQVNTAVSQMEKITQENAAAAEENAASVISLKDEIKNLEGAVYIAKELIRNGENTKNTETEFSNNLDNSDNIKNININSSDNINNLYKPKKNDPEKIITLDEKNDF